MFHCTNGVQHCVEGRRAGEAREASDDVTKELAKVVQALTALEASQSQLASTLAISSHSHFEQLLQNEAQPQQLGAAPKLRPWQETQSLGSSAAHVFARSKLVGKKGGAGPDVISVTKALCGMGQSALEEALARVPDFTTGNRWLFNNSWLTQPELRALDEAHVLGAGSEVVCLVGYIKQQVPCPASECVVPVYVRPDTSDSLVLGQMYETVELGFVANFAPTAILDAGANIGLAAQVFGHMFPDAVVVSVEAASDNFAMLRLNTAHLPNVVPLHAGIWQRTTQLEVTVTGDGEWGHILREADTCPPGAECVNALTIDLIQDLLQVGRFDFAKIDIESSEKGVFTPSAVNRLAWLAGVKAVAIELHDRFVPGCTEAVTSALENDFDIDSGFNSEYVLAVRKKA
ncbi:hypothetical protein KFL_007180020 [Klebsormidium nitens]|uniref:Methyltransferase FkbM domain-containing protein n=1 Tax=Klebsormidium nitens TaxID=105231 RepID=A0A1Y1IPD2_KLENI|nr:hypothetical protein KFL_007180020 [Klebsormidium nitens]|eukprot:GAQ91041.1 hypothetical protein KFL_007180020 [Klebsormidium nitens]